MLPAVNSFAYFEEKSRAGTLDIRHQDGLPMVWLSAGAARQHGIADAPARLPLSAWLDNLSPDSRHRLQSLWEDAAESAEFTGEIDVRQPGGAWVRLHLLAERRLENGEPRLSGLFLERETPLPLLRADEDAAPLTDRRYQQAMQALGVGVWSLDIPSGALDSQEVCPLAPTLRAWEERLHPEDREPFFRQLDRHWCGLDPVFRYEARCRPEDSAGNWRRISVQGRVVDWDRLGQALRMIGICQESPQDPDAARRAQRLQAYEQAFRAAGGYAGLLSPEGHILEVNDTVLAFLGIPAESLRGKLLWEGFWWLSDDVRQDIRRMVIAAAEGTAGERRVEVEGAAFRRAGVQMTLKPLRDKDGAVCRIFAEGRDIPLVTLQEAPIETDIESGVATVSREGRFLSVNAAMTRLTGHDENELLTLTLMDILHPDDLVRDMGYLQGLLDGACESFQVEKRCLRKGGGILRVRLEVQAVSSENGRAHHFTCLMHPLHALDAPTPAPTGLSRIDDLTGLPNRVALDSCLRQLLMDARQTGRHPWLIYMDIDHFQTINEAHGHQEGDRLIRELAQAFRRHLREHDLLARLGGDEFAVVLADCSQDAAQRVAQHLIETAAHYRLQCANGSDAVGVSIGLAGYDPSLTDAGQWLTRADTACYSAKEQGRGRVQVYHPDATQIRAAHHHLDWARRLAAALDEGRFALFLQRIVDVRGQTTGHEALIRMRDEEHGLVSPQIFMPVAKRMGLSSRIDRWVIQAVLDLYRDLTQRGIEPSPGCYVSLNLSATSVGDPQFQEWLLARLDEYEVSPGRLCFEITETERLQAGENELKLIETLRLRGFRIWLDDFGTGYNSFAILKRIPVDGLKIDSNVTRDVLSDPVDRALLEAAVFISRTLNLEIVAEGVESEAVRDALVELGIPKLQGFLFHSPSPAADIRFG